MPQRRNYRRKRPFKSKWKVGGNIKFPGGIGAGFNFDSRVAKVAKRVALKQQETKEGIRRISSALLNGNIYTTNLLGMGIGTGVLSRKDDSIFLCGINLKYEVKSSNPDTLWRFFVIKAKNTFPVSAVTSDTLSATGFTNQDMFRNGDTSPVGYLNSDKLTVLSSQTLRVKPSQANETLMVREARANIKIMKPFQYKSGDTYEGRDYNIYLVVVPYDNAIGAGSTAVGTFTVSTEIVYKDA